jgi:hypothetical protein
MSCVCATKELNPIETIQVRLAAEIFAWMQIPAVSGPAWHEMARFLEALDPPVHDLAQPAGTPAATLRQMCESDAGVRLRLGLVLRHAPLYLELSARAFPAFGARSRFEHAAWLYLTPKQALRRAEWHLGAVSCPPELAAEFLDSLERRVALQAADTTLGAPQAA